MRWARFVGGSIVALALAVMLSVQFGSWQVARLNARVDELEREKTKLIQYAERLSGARRVAQIDVESQTVSAAGQTVTNLQWQELGPENVRGTVRQVSVLGDQVYFEALVLKFEHKLVAHGDSHENPVVNLALFRRIFGNQQSPEAGVALDREVFPILDADKSAQADASKLWSRFWDFADDPREAAKFGVRIAQCEAPSVRMQPGQVWEVSLDNSGGVNLRKLSQKTGG